MALPATVSNVAVQDQVAIEVGAAVIDKPSPECQQEPPIKIEEVDH